MSNLFDTLWRSTQNFLSQPNFIMQLAIIAVITAVGWWLNHWLQQRLIDDGSNNLRHVAISSSQRIFFPFFMALSLWLAAEIMLNFDFEVAVLQLLQPVALALGVIRLLVYMLRKAFLSSPLLKTLEPLISTLIWLVLVLHLAGWLSATLALIDQLALTVGTTRISLLMVLELIMLITAAFTVSLWLSEIISQRLKNSRSISPSMQVGLVKFSKFFLVTVAFLVALNAAGISMSSLAVFGGALGVGLGLGLQRIASNFISGFILVLDRSVKPGDLITVGENFGRVEQLNARYVVLRNRQGVDSLIPNEHLIINEVTNWSYADPNVRLEIDVQVSYNDDPEQAMALMLESAYASPRVLTTPEPTVRLLNFADNGIHLQLRVWIADLENGRGAVKSDINRAIWHKFKQQGISFPYPQRDLHLKSGWPPAAASGQQDVKG
ncbi:MAG TPA: mechanosensitive ion channel protein MscS [Rheinheimera sp.]|uniref:mechanosensitive ion channel family protein n=1 Tax=Rheinheimera sp. TaxID=1869214 RepID=UPI000EDCB426|nr:mechanosensitive ion channel domain-containing protein [Rheinheimera sp.]HCU65834.1 mechanosensitive ion channel protein MscS [Rheinheimera sp.]